MGARRAVHSPPELARPRISARPERLELVILAVSKGRIPHIQKQLKPPNPSWQLYGRGNNLLPIIDDKREPTSQDRAVSPTLTRGALVARARKRRVVSRSHSRATPGRMAPGKAPAVSRNYRSATVPLPPGPHARERGGH